MKTAGVVGGWVVVAAGGVGDEDRRVLTGGWFLWGGVLSLWLGVCLVFLWLGSLGV